LALAGFPYERRRVRERFLDLLRATEWDRHQADARLLCIHHCVEGATVGPTDYTFRNAKDVIRCRDLPDSFAGVLSGHIHRHQVLRHDLRGRTLETPVLYPGSVERTAFAEKDEEKGFLLLDVGPEDAGGRIRSLEFVPLPARPMLVRNLVPDDGAESTWTSGALLSSVEAAVAQAPREAVLRVKIEGEIPDAVRPMLTATRVRALAPPEMNLEIMLAQDRAPRAIVGQKRKPEKPQQSPQHGLALVPR
jgi:DNA repair exonuclease SbcCD nuclease subunit